MGVRSRTHAARRLLVSQASTMTSSCPALSPTLASALDAPSATTPSLTMASRTARLHACLAGASLVASAAPSLLRMHWVVALASRHLLPTHAWRLLRELGTFTIFFF